MCSSKSVSGQCATRGSGFSSHHSGSTQISHTFRVLHGAVAAVMQFFHPLGIASQPEYLSTDLVSDCLISARGFAQCPKAACGSCGFCASSLIAVSKYLLGGAITPCRFSPIALSSLLALKALSIADVAIPIARTYCAAGSHVARRN